MGIFRQLSFTWRLKLPRTWSGTISLLKVVRASGDRFFDCHLCFLIVKFYVEFLFFSAAESTKRVQAAKHTSTSSVIGKEVMLVHEVKWQVGSCAFGGLRHNEPAKKIRATTFISHKREIINMGRITSRAGVPLPTSDVSRKYAGMRK